MPTPNYAPDKSAMAMLHSSYSSITSVINTEPNVTVSFAVSSFAFVPSYLCQLAQNIPFTVSSLLYFTIRIDFNANHICSFVRVLTSCGSKVSCWCNCSSSLPIAFSTLPGNFFRASLKLYCVIT